MSRKDLHINALRHVVQHIQKQGRADRLVIDEYSNCSYYFEGKTCAVGCLLANPEEFEAWTNNLDANAGHNGSTSIEELVLVPGYAEAIKFLPEFEGLSVRFLQELQLLHDNQLNWIESGTVGGGWMLTELGKNKVDEIFKMCLKY